MKATIVSFVPWELNELKPGQNPDTYRIPASDGKVPQVLVIEDAVSHLYLGYDRGTYPTPIPVDKLAESIINDSTRSVLEYDPNTKPALFWVEGEFTAKEVMAKFPDKIKEVLASQNRWFMKLIKLADDMWSRFHQHKMISDLQRIAAQQLGLSNKEWAITPEPVQLIPCPACTTMIQSTAIVCKNCRAILKPEEAKKAGITFAVGA